MLMSWKNAGRNKLVEAGTYMVEVKEWKDYQAQSGNPCIIVEYEVVGPDGNENIGLKVSDFITLTEKSAWKLGWLVNTCGVETEKLPDMDTASEEFKNILNTLKGRTLWLTCTKEIYNSKDVNKVVDYMPDNDQEAITITEEVPDFIKNKKGGKGKELPF